MGGSLPQFGSCGSLVLRPIPTSHQHVGDVGCPERSKRVRLDLTHWEDPSEVGQHHCGVLHSEAGGHSFPLPVCVSRAYLDRSVVKGRALTASHFEGKVNILADLLSRGHLIVQTEWTLAHQVLQQVWALWGKPWIDLFATKFSKRLPVYVSPVPDPEAWQVDALAFSWRGLEAYAFPPFPLISEVLRKARQDQPSLILIASDWPAQSWYADLLRQSQGRKLALQILPNSCFNPGREFNIQSSAAQAHRLEAVKRRLDAIGASKLRLISSLKPIGRLQSQFMILIGERGTLGV